MGIEHSTKEAIIKDLEIQWNDHFHMRDQTWKTLANSVLFFLGIVGLEIKGIVNFVMIPAYIILIFIAFIGWAVAAHHRLRQKQKFAIIKIYEEELNLFKLKQKIIEKADSKKNVAGKIFTARFIEIMQIAIGVVALILLLRRLFFI